MKRKNHLQTFTFTDLYTKIDAGVSMEDLNNVNDGTEEEVPEVKDDEPPF